MQLKKDGQTGLSETDVLILKNVLEVLPSKYFDKKVKEDSLDMDEKEIHEALLSYRGRKKRNLISSKSEINLRKQTNLTKYDAVKQALVLKEFFNQERRLNSTTQEQRKRSNRQSNMQSSSQPLHELMRSRFKEISKE